jgi:hypothetical protein
MGQNDPYRLLRGRENSAFLVLKKLMGRSNKIKQMEISMGRYEKRFLVKY